MHQFQAYEVALQLATELRAPIDLLRRRDRDLADQLRRATASVFLNIAEGDGKRSLRDQARSFSIALGSCREARAALRLAAVWRLVDAASIVELDALADRVCALLSRLIARAA